jgi:hypothetical protein
MDYFGELVNRAVEELGPEATPANIEAAEEAFRRLTQEVSSELGGTVPAGAGTGGDEILREAAASPIRVSGPQIESVLGGLCPGFFPFC